MTTHLRRLALFAMLWAMPAAGCAPAADPAPTRALLHLTGSPYQRGLQHGTQLADQIREFYTSLLTASLLPYLNREQPDIDAVLTTYQGSEYGNGQFTEQLFLDSAAAMERQIPAEYVQEMQGVADGSGMTYNRILILNTFVDTTLAVRSVAEALDLSNAPRLLSVNFLGAATDGVDNDADGGIDQPGEGRLSPYRATPTAPEVELPTTVAFQFVLDSPHGVDPTSVHLTLDAQVFTSTSPEVTTEPAADGGLEITLTPATPLDAASVHALSIVAGDSLVVPTPAPAHEPQMRQEQITFTTLGYGQAPGQVPNRSQGSPTGPPTSMAFAVTGSATPDGQPRLAQHFALLDDNTSHNNTAVFVHQPDDGTPPFVVVGWAGIVWGFSGLNTLGLGLACQPSDTLDNAVVGGLIESAADLSQAKLIATGMPIGFAIRQLLQKSATADDAVTQLNTMQYAYGWGCLLADASGSIHAAEIDGALNGGGTGVFDYGPDPSQPGNLDPSGRPWASIGLDDLRLAGHYLKNTDDMFTLTLEGKRILPQSQWATTYFRSLDTYAGLGDALGSSLGQVDTAHAEAILSLSSLVDSTDSMNAVVIEPGALKLYSAMGSEPATASPFVELDLGPVVQ